MILQIIGWISDQQISEFIHKHPNLPWILILILFTGVVIKFISMIVKTAKYEIKSAKFRKSIKTGDHIWLSSRYLEGKIVKIDPNNDYVTIESKVHKNNIYPKDAV